MIDVQNGKYSFASELSKAKASAPWAALHISSAHAICGLSEINHHMKHTREKKINYICSLIEGCPKKGKFTKIQKNLANEKNSIHFFVACNKLWFNGSNTCQS